MGVLHFSADGRGSEKTEIRDYCTKKWKMLLAQNGNEVRCQTEGKGHPYSIKKYIT